MAVSSSSCRNAGAPPKSAVCSARRFLAITGSSTTGWAKSGWPERRDVMAGGLPEVVGRPYEDGSGNKYLAMYRQPVVVYATDGPGLAQAHAKALSRGLDMAIYTEDMFKTDNDDDNRAAVRSVAVEALQFVGIVVYGPRNAVDKVFKGLALHT